MRTLLVFAFGRKCDNGSECVEIVGKKSCTAGLDLAVAGKFTADKSNSTNSSSTDWKSKFALVVVMSAVGLWKPENNPVWTTYSASVLCANFLNMSEK